MIIFLLLFSLVYSSFSLERCYKYIPRIVKEARYFIGLDAPFHYFVAQIEVESACNPNITAFDGGMGLAQFMPKTAEEVHKQFKELQEFPLNPYDPRWSIRAMILYDKLCYEKTLCKGWYFAFRSYNGGIGNMNKEIRRAQSCEPKVVENYCIRTPINCKINISYPYKIFQKSEKYKGIIFKGGENGKANSKLHSRNTTIFEK